MQIDSEVIPEEPEQELSQLEVKRADGDRYNATYSFTNEDHTLGNLLRNQIIKNSNVEFCAYSVPHPSEPIMNVRIQCYNNAGENDTKKVMNHGLKRISKMCDVLTEKMNKELENHTMEDE